MAQEAMLSYSTPPSIPKDFHSTEGPQLHHETNIFSMTLRPCRYVLQVHLMNIMKKNWNKLYPYKTPVSLMHSGPHGLLSCGHPSLCCSFSLWRWLHPLGRKTGLFQTP